MQPLTFRDIPEDPSRPDLVREAWEDFRGMGYADLVAVQDALNDRRQAVEGERSAHYTETEQGKTIQVLRARSYAAGMLRQWIEENGTDPPEWSDLVAPEQTRKWAEKAYPHLDEEGMSVRGLCRFLAEQEEGEVSPSTPIKWLCRKNPLYVGAEDGEEMQHLKDVVKRICLRTNVNGTAS